MTPVERPDPCPDCGAENTGDPNSCNRLFEEVMEREFSHPEIFHVHRLTVDCYSLQHPDRYMKSAKSAAAHLTGMCWAMERGGGPEVSQALSRWLDGTPDLPTLTPPPPLHRGALTIRHLHSAPDSAEHVRRVREWAESAWEAWEVHHEQARSWVEEALARARRRR